MLEGFDIEKYKSITPPGDYTFDTMQEIKALTKIPINKDAVEKYDYFHDAFKEVAKRKGLDEDKVEEVCMALSDEAHPFIMKLKDYFDRPRPKVIAKKMNIKMDDIEMESMKTPSYPSGHSAQGYLVGLVLSDMYPSAKKEFMQVANNISDSRNIAHAHYKSDSDFGKMLGKEMYEHIKSKA